VPPHWFLSRARLRAATGRLTREGTHAIEVALDSGSCDVAHRDRVLRAEFGAVPAACRAASPCGATAV
jgi:AraC-like DNA-binding protein